MEFQTLIKDRRSVRKYKEGTSITREVLDEILKDSQLAASWKNSQTARYYIADTPEALELVRQGMPDFNLRNTMNAPVLMVTTFVKGLAGCSTDYNYVNEAGDCWGGYDMGFAHAYLLLAAREHGIDSLITGMRDSEILRKVCNIPDDEMIMAVLAFGYRDGEPVFRERKNLDEIRKYL